MTKLLVSLLKSLDLPCAGYGANNHSSHTSTQTDKNSARILKPHFSPCKTSTFTSAPAHCTLIAHLKSLPCTNFSSRIYRQIHSQIEKCQIHRQICSTSTSKEEEPDEREVKWKRSSSEEERVPASSVTHTHHN
ncbi:hypothetical protein KC19_1G163200 [Ceratodon purpureus]|uniref:Uncharacterized protein n=1 Tax=Ceratodon purpureus TaxID=3225 RepID=A0A8T0J8V8_CERPU|nr:hypothetical protein KC19_1G163200 [Ceratodon purpureus]